MNVFSAGRNLRLTLTGLAMLYPCSSGVMAREMPNPWLALPQIGREVSGDSSGEFREAPDSIHDIVVHIPYGGSHILYGTIHTKVNTESADLATQSVSNSDGLELRIQLTAAGGFQFQAGRNSVELEYQDQFGRPKYTNFLLTFRASARPHTSTPEMQVSVPGKRVGRIFAVVIGISRYDRFGSTIANLKYADRDAMSFAEFLKSPAGGGLPDDTVATLLNEHATTQNIRYSLFTFLTLAQPQDTVVVYIAGHGAPDPHDPRNLYLLTADTKPDDIGRTAFPMGQMQDLFDRVLKAKRVLTIADTCRGYGFIGSGNGDDGPKENNLINQYLQRYAAKGEHAVITASDISETSLEDARWGDGHGVFTYYLLKGLKGDADKNHDGIVTAAELFAYLQRVVPEATGGAQNPRAIYGLAANLPISILKSSTATIQTRESVDTAMAQR